MSHYKLFVLICVIVAIASYLNHRYLKLPKPIGFIIISALFSLILAIFVDVKSNYFVNIYLELDKFDFKEIVLQGMLGYLLFASAMQLTYMNLKKYVFEIISLSTLGVLISALIVGLLSWLLVPFILNKQEPFLVCLLVGVIIAPTDPVTISAIFKQSKNTPNKIKTILEGESLFNDVTAIVLFTALITIIFASQVTMSTLDITLLFLREGIGGILIGIIMGYIGMLMMKKTDDSQVLITISLAIVSLGYIITELTDVSGPLVMVISGLIIGNSNCLVDLSQKSQQSFNNFWHTIDELLNAFLFVLIGIKILEIDYSNKVLLVGLYTFAISILARYVSIVISIFIANKFNFKHKRQIVENKSDNKDNISMTWAGLRGGVSIALSLSLPLDNTYTLIFSIVYITVLMSIFVQGTSFKKLLNIFYKT